MSRSLLILPENQTNKRSGVYIVLSISGSQPSSCDCHCCNGQCIKQLFPHNTRQPWGTECPWHGRINRDYNTREMGHGEMQTEPLTRGRERGRTELWTELLPSAREGPEAYQCPSKKRCWIQECWKLKGIKEWYACSGRGMQNRRNRKPTMRAMHFTNKCNEKHDLLLYIQNLLSK